MSDRLSLIRPFYGPDVKKLVARRLANHAPLVGKDQRLTEKEKIQIKIALLVVHTINPFEEFFDTESALIRGVHWKTFAKRRAANETDRGILREQ